MKPFFVIAIIATVAALLMTACGATSSHGGHSMSQIMATVEKSDFSCEVENEKSDFSCEVEKRHPKKFAEVGSCRSNQDKYQKLIINQWNDPKVRDQMYEQKIPKMCSELGMKGQVHWSTSGSWTLVAGGSKASDLKALGKATNALGFEPHVVPCQ